MNVIIFSLTVLVMYGIISYAYKLWKRADLQEKMGDLEEIDTQNESILQYKKSHKGSYNKKRKTIKNFYEE
jgi:hypothetical protein